MSLYSDLGLKRIINGWGTVTKIGGSLMDPEVLAAMNEAARAYVDVRTLHRKAGERIAGLLGVEAASITAGAAAGMAIAAAACITKGDPAAVLQLPDTAGLPHEVLMLKAHRILYDQAVSLSGARIREIGVTSAAHPAQIKQAVSDRTAMFLYIAEAERMRGSLPLPEIAAVLRSLGIPIVVDAAAELPPKANVTQYLEQGADLVIFSGGKEIRGPQSSGLIVGRKEWVAYCDANNYPNYSIGRSMKLDKETIAGLVRAVEMFAERDYDQELARWEAMTGGMIVGLTAIPGISARRGFPTEPGVQPVLIPRAYFTHNQVSARDLQERLLEADPMVYIDVQGDEAVINPQCLTPEEVPQLLQAVRDALTRR